VLDAAAQLIDIEHDKHFATVLCGIADLPGHRVTIASAGHLPPLIVSEERTEFLAVPTGAPIGVRTGKGYVSTTVPVPSGATLLAYTDGLVERRNETLDDGLRRLMDAARAAGAGGEALVDGLMTALLPDGNDDDTAVLGLQWRS
jgi:serine phosphatase RsbU (regulator of sigma subunit)